MRLVLAILPLAVMAACSSFASNEPAVTAGDASTGDADASVAPTDGAVVDAGPVHCKDRVNDARHFCEDWDLSTTLGFGWNPAIDQGVLHEADAATSPPRALAVGVAASNGGFAVLRRDLGAADLASAKKATVAFSLRVPAVPVPASYTHVFGLELDNNTSCPSDGGATIRQVNLTFFPDKFVVAAIGLGDECGGTDFAAAQLPWNAANIAAQGYVRVSLELSRVSCSGGVGGALRTSFAGIPGDLCLDFGSAQPLDRAKRFQLAIGVVAGGAVTAGEADYDDITVDVE